MGDNRTKWLLALGALVGLCVVSLLCVVAVGGYSIFTRASGGDTGGPVPDDDAVVEGGTGETSGISKGTNELVLLGADPPTLDPALASDATSANYIVEIFSGLVGLDPELEIVPDIAESWEVGQDGTLYTFTLRADVVFADGRPVTAEDFKYSMERACDPATQSPVADTYLGDIVGCREKLRGSTSEVSGVRVVDPSTLEIQIDAPKVYFLAKLTYPTAFVVDRETIEREGRLWASSTPNGTGPFKLQEYTFAERLVLVPNENYYGEPKPSLDEVTYILSGGSGMTMYETDEIDIVGVGLADLDRVLDPSSPLNEDLREVESFSIGYIGLNAQMPPFDDPLVRQAFNLAIDKEALAEVVLEGTVTP
ncbi:MAG: peptide ABC transporter substrate-binding protein, partial [Ardenticatenaceae bacterium]